MRWEEGLTVDVDALPLQDALPHVLLQPGDFENRCDRVFSQHPCTLEQAVQPNHTTNMQQQHIRCGEDKLRRGLMVGGGMHRSMAESVVMVPSMMGRCRKSSFFCLILHTPSCQLLLPDSQISCCSGQ
jgi:hypothetical protein